MRAGELLTLFLVVFVGMLGYGLMVPLVPLMALKLGVSKTFITWVVASYALSQLVGAPVWGRLSDKYGRRPVLIWTAAVSTVGYIVLAFANSLWLLLLARAIGGFSAGNLSTAYAYVSDKTSPKERARAIGRVSAAFSLGFMVGPAFGGLLAGGTGIGDANFSRPALAAAMISALALAGTYFLLPESRVRTGDEAQAPSQNLLSQNIALLRRPALLIMAGLTLLAFATTSVLQSIFALWMEAVLAFAALQIGLLFSYSGIVVTLTQGILIGPLAERFGEQRVLQAGYMVYALGLVGLVMTHSLPVLLVSATLTSFGTGVFSTCLPTLFSNETTAGDRGAIIALYQSTGSFARFLGPTFSGALFERVAMTAPFWFGIAAMALASGLTLLLARISSSTREGSDGGQGQ